MIRHIVIFFSCISLFASFVQTAHAQWKQSETLSSKRINCMAIKGNNIFAGTDEGVFISADKGSSWNVSVSGLSNVSIWTLDVSGTTVFTGTHRGVFFSNDTGLSWNECNYGFTDTIPL